MPNPILTAVALAAVCPLLSAQWDPATPPANPGALTDAAMSNCTVTGNVLVFGGKTSTGAANDQLWSFNGDTWFPMNPWASPPGRWGGDMVYDPIGLFLTYGGENASPTGGAALADFWGYNGNLWVQINPATSPGSLAHYGMCFDSARDRVIIYGGRPDNRFPTCSNLTWEWDRVDWSLITTALNPSPGPLERPALCFHQGLSKAVLFGGVDPQTGGTDKTWLYDGATWTELAITGQKPSPRRGPRMEYDSFRGVCVLTGGTDVVTGAPIVDTWEFNGSSWTQIPSTIPGAGRIASMMGYLMTRRVMVHYGGVDAATSAVLADTWLFGAKNGTYGIGCPGVNGIPELSAQDAPRLGQSYVLEVINLNQSFNLAAIVFGFAPHPGLDLDALLGMPGCAGYVVPDFLYPMVPGVSGTASATWSPVTGSLGDTFYGQALCFDPSVNAFGWTISNAVSATIGY